MHACMRTSMRTSLPSTTPPALPRHCCICVSVMPRMSWNLGTNAAQSSAAQPLPSLPVYRAGASAGCGFSAPDFLLYRRPSRRHVQQTANSLISACNPQSRDVGVCSFSDFLSKITRWIVSPRSSVTCPDHWHACRRFDNARVIIAQCCHWAPVFIAPTTLVFKYRAIKMLAAAPLAIIKHNHNCHRQAHPLFPVYARCGGIALATSPSGMRLLFH
jgi:hypothetical protein